MKFVIYLFCFLVIAFATQSQTTWEALDGPFGGYPVKVIQSQNSIYISSSKVVFGSKDDGQSWRSLFKVEPDFYLSNLISQGDEILYAVAQSLNNQENKIFQSNDAGNTWAKMNFFSERFSTGKIFITSQFIYSLTNDSMRYCSLTDTIIKTKNYKEYSALQTYVDKSDNLYLISKNYILKSSDKGNKIDTIYKSSTSLDYLNTDNDENLYFISNISNGTRITYASNFNKNWKVIDIPNEYWGRNALKLDSNNFYLNDMNSSTWLLSIEDTVRFTKVWNSSEDSNYIENIFIANKNIIINLHNEKNYITKDKELTNLRELKLSLQTIDKLSAGKTLVVAGGQNISYLSGNSFVEFDDKSIYYNNLLSRCQLIFVSQKDYFWYTYIGMGPLEFNLIDNVKNKVKELSFGYSPSSLTENSKGNLFSLSWGGNRLINSLNQIDWNLNQNILFNYGVQIMANKEDNLFVYQTSDSSLIKLDGNSFSELSRIKLQIEGIFIKMIAVSINDIFIISTKYVYRSSDGGTNWTAVFDGAGNGKTIRDIININSFIYVATQQGILESKDLGTTWNDFNSGLNSFDCYTLAKTADNTLYVGLSNDVVYRNSSMTLVDDNTVNNIDNIVPNPATNYIIFNNGNNKEQIEIYDIFGVQKDNWSFLDTSMKEGTEIKLNVSSLLPGIYIIKTGTSVKRFIKI